MSTQPVTSSKDSADEGERTYTIGTDFGSNTSFKGVNQSSEQLYFSPNFIYSAKSGFYFYTAAYYLQGQVNPWDELDLSVGYDFNLTKKTAGSISYMKSFFSSTSPQVNSSLTNNIQAFLKRKFWSVKTKLVFDFYFGDETDYAFSLINSRSFMWEEVFTKNDDITITPKLRIVAGSQNFYFTKNSLVKASKSLKKGTTWTTVTTQISTSEFGIISYIFSLPLSYTIKKYTIEPAFYYSIAGLTQRANNGYFTLSLYCILP